ncbi:hypothetical protein DPEC_G00161350 [Dallia pectoralis]|uniref:Uncharacterized protein n=1 Tax=Dallia pectoralis TaxID=75939 RepID=A0ACC2GGR8_DALPE|nr:hypothetical protein DPEC_G00161350 [Dallia pectoralis]
MLYNSIAARVNGQLLYTTQLNESTTPKVCILGQNTYAQDGSPEKKSTLLLDVGQDSPTMFSSNRNETMMSRAITHRRLNDIHGPGLIHRLRARRYPRVWVIPACTPQMQKTSGVARNQCQQEDRVSYFVDSTGIVSPRVIFFQKCRAPRGHCVLFGGRVYPQVEEMVVYKSLTLSHRVRLFRTRT